MRNDARAPMRVQDSLRLRLPVLIAALITIILAAFLWTSHQEVERAVLRTGGERAQVAADQLAALFAQNITRTVAEMRRVADDETTRRYLRTPAETERPIVEQRLRSLATAGQPPVVLVNAAGHRIVEIAGPSSTSVSPAPLPPVDVPSHIGVAPFQITDGVVFTDIVAEVVNEPSDPAPDSAARRLGFVIVRRTMAAAQASEMLGRLIGAGARVAVGNRSNEVWTNLSTPVPAPLVDRERRGRATYATGEGARWVGALAPIEGTPWTAWIEFPEAAVLAPARDVLRRLVWLACGFVIVAAVLVAVLSASITKPLSALTQASEAIAAGDYSRRIVTERRDEIGRLGIAFTTMTARVQEAHRGLEDRVRQRTEQLDEAHGELDQFFSVSIDLLCIADHEGRFTRVNPAWEEVLGWTVDDLTSRPFLDFVHPEDQAVTSAEAAKLADGHLTVSFENRYRCKDGSYRWLNWKAAPVPTRGLIYAAARDVTALKRAEQALHDRMTELADINHELESFSYSVSHDLRAPLRHITGFAALFERSAGARLQESDRRYLHTITDAAGRMGRLIDDLLAFSRMGRTVVTKQRVALGSIVEAARQELAPLTAGREIQWSIPALPEVEADPTMLQLAIVNLLSNAIKYTSTRAQAHIEVGTTHDETGDLVVFVRDNGVGFDMQYVAKLFGVFQRLHRSDEFDGTGIGLANVRRIVHRHRGRVWAEGALNHGATFFFSLPGRGSQT